MSFILKPATRVGVRPLICLFSESGCGKTMSALLIARGFVGSSGKIVIGDTESGRGQLYADVIPGGYEHFEINPPFSPANAKAAVNFMEDSGASIGILDSCSAFWESTGGVLDMASDIESSSGKTGLHVWKKPKFEHALFIQALMRSKIPLVLCVRAKFKSRQTKENGKTVIIKDDFTSPMQAEDFIFEMTTACEIMPDHSCRVTKCSHPDLRKCFPSAGPITIEHGRLLGAWCQGAGEPANQPAAKRTVETARSEMDAFAAAKKELWRLLEKTIMGRQGDDAIRVVNQFLYDEIGMDPSMSVKLMTLPELLPVIEKVKSHKSKTHEQNTETTN